MWQHGGVGAVSSTWQSGGQGGKILCHLMWQSGMEAVASSMLCGRMEGRRRVVEDVEEVVVVKDKFKLNFELTEIVRSTFT